MLPQKLRKVMAQASRIHRNYCLSGNNISRNFLITSQTMQTSTHSQPKKDLPINTGRFTKRYTEKAIKQMKTGNPLGVMNP